MQAAIHDGIARILRAGERQAFWPPPNRRHASGWRPALFVAVAWTPCCWSALRRICWRAFARKPPPRQCGHWATDTAAFTPCSTTPGPQRLYDGESTYHGAGAIGGWLGVALAQAGGSSGQPGGAGETLRLQTRGLRMWRTDGTLAQVPVTAHSDPAALGVQDLVVIAVKGPGLPDVARAIAPLLGPHTVVLTAMNGVPWWFLDGVGGAAQGRALESVDAGA